MTSPSTAITIDGPTAWLVVECPPDSAPARWEQADKQCDTCNGVGWLTWTYLTKPGTKTFDCTDCHGTGRFTFTLDVECDDSIHLPFVPDLADDDPWYVPGDRECRQCDESGTYQLSVHVVEVLPIVDGDLVGVPRPVIHSYPVIAAGKVVTWYYLYAVNGEDDGHLTLPDDAAPDKYAVRLAVAA
jgi:hypothetical protein